MTDPDPTVQALVARTRHRGRRELARLAAPLAVLAVAAPVALAAPGWRLPAAVASVLLVAALAAAVAHGESLPSALEIVAAQALVQQGEHPAAAADRALAASRTQLWRIAGPDGPARVAARVDLPAAVYEHRREQALRQPTTTGA